MLLRSTFKIFFKDQDIKIIETIDGIRVDILLCVSFLITNSCEIYVYNLR